MNDTLSEFLISKDTLYNRLIKSLINECDIADKGMIPTSNIVKLIEKSINDMKLINEEFKSLVKR